MEHTLLVDLLPSDYTLDGGWAISEKLLAYQPPDHLHF